MNKQKHATAIMLQGTGSDVGKSLIVAGLCRAFVKQGFKVAPFKPQNMSNNAAVTPDGGEIGRAQALQAIAAKVPASVHMNPVLLKPQTQTGAQVVVQGVAQTSLTARQYFKQRQKYLPAILKSFNKLKSKSDLVIVEGAGSPAEINLRDGDIANMGFAEAGDVPVLLVGDIHRGGVIASIAGTYQIISKADANRLKGFLINNFHGDIGLFDEGRTILEEATNSPCLGIIPHFAQASALPPEDAVAIEAAKPTGDGNFHICVPRLSRIANFDDLDPLKLEPGVRLEIIQPGNPFPASCDLIIIPGSKATIADIAYMRKQGWDIDIIAHARRGGHVLGICGGYQMLGKTISDPEGIEGNTSSTTGLGLLDIDTVLHPNKVLGNVTGTHHRTNTPVSGYEIHIGHTEKNQDYPPFAVVDGRPEGAVKDHIAGTYLHGCFINDEFRKAYFSQLNVQTGQLGYGQTVETTLDQLADHLEAHLDLEQILRLAK